MNKEHVKQYLKYLYKVEDKNKKLSILLGLLFLSIGLKTMSLSIGIILISISLFMDIITFKIGNNKTLESFLPIDKKDKEFSIKTYLVINILISTIVYMVGSKAPIGFSVFILLIIVVLKIRLSNLKNTEY